MADFVQNSQTKNAVRMLASPIADVTAFNSIVQSVITDNPFACVAYMTAGINHDPVKRPGIIHRTDQLPGRKCKDRRQLFPPVQHPRRVQRRGNRIAGSRCSHHGTCRYRGPRPGR